MTESSIKTLSLHEALTALRNQATTALSVLDDKTWQESGNNPGGPWRLEIGDFVITARFKDGLIAGETHPERMCAYTGPGRGDCAHFLPIRIGMPMDSWGKPVGWCWSCWNSHRYHELLFAVARCFPGETRHQTALRYIQEAEARSWDGPAQELNPKP